MNIVIVDYAMGNLKSLTGALQHIGCKKISISSEYASLTRADKLILPGVGGFNKAMRRLKEENIDCYLNELIVESKKPILGICLGMQLMTSSSSENGITEGLGLVPGRITKFNTRKEKIPHVGFNQVDVNPNLKLFSGLTGLTDFYFTHSYKMNSDKQINPCFCHYEENFIASYEIDHIAGVQFHPELSQTHGLTVLKNFVENF